MNITYKTFIHFWLTTTAATNQEIITVQSSVAFVLCLMVIIAGVHFRVVSRDLSRPLGQAVTFCPSYSLSTYDVISKLDGLITVFFAEISQIIVEYFWAIDISDSLTHHCLLYSFFGILIKKALLSVQTNQKRVLDFGQLFLVTSWMTRMTHSWGYWAITRRCHVTNGWRQLLTCFGDDNLLSIFGYSCKLAW